jgi:hypothetical protein
MTPRTAGTNLTYSIVQDLGTVHDTRAPARRRAAAAN